MIQIHHSSFKRIHLFLLLILFFSFEDSVFAQWQTAYVGKPTPTSIAASSAEERLFVSLSNGGLWKTQDFGEDWTPLNQNIGPSRIWDCNNISIYDVNADTLTMRVFGWYPSYPGRRGLYSINNGATWSETNAYDYWPDDLNFSSNSKLIISDIDSDNWYLFQYHAVAISYNGGLDWEVIPYDSLSISLTDVFMLDNDPNNIFLYGVEKDSTRSPLYTNIGGILHSGDGGRSWERISILNSFDNIHELSVSSLIVDPVDHSSYAVINNPSSQAYPPLFLVKLVHNGSWQEIDTNISDSIYPFRISQSVSDRSKYFMLPANGIGLYVSNDMCENWDMLVGDGLPDTPYRCTAFFQNPDTGRLYLGTQYDGLFFSDDAGITWSEVSLPPLGASQYSSMSGLKATSAGVSFLDGMNNSWWYGVENSHFEADNCTTTGDSIGVITPILYSSEEVRLRGIRFHDGSYNFGSSGLLKSEDGGYSWSYWNIDSLLSDNSGINWIGSDKYGNSSIIYVIYNNYSSLSYSYDHGQSWDEANLPDNCFELFVFHTDLVAVTTTLDYYMSHDMGHSWVNYELPFTPSFEYQELEPLLLENTLYIRHNGTVWKATSPDGWEELGFTFTSSTFAWDVVTTEHDTIFAMGSIDFPRLYLSDDFGRNWTQHQVSIPYTNQGAGIWDIEYDRYRNKLWVDTGVGLVWMDVHVLSTATDIEAIPISYELLEVYPNPFNDSAMIHYNLTDNQRVEINLFNINGQAVNQIYKGHQFPGNHIVSIHNSYLSSGTYIVQLRTENSIRNKRVTILK